MAKKQSFAKIEQQIRPGYRNNLNIADSTEDVKKFFVYVVRDFFDKVFHGRIAIDFEDIRLDRDSPGGILYSDALMNNIEFRETLESSDFTRIVEDLAENGLNRIKHLEEKQPGKTEAKPFQTHSGAGRDFKSRAGR